MAGISDAGRAAQAMDELRTRVVDLADPEITDWIGEVEADPMTKSILEAVFSNSPFLTNCALAEIPFLKDRSEERRVGKECRSRWSPYH
jgi:hypothetical protein